MEESLCESLRIYCDWAVENHYLEGDSADLSYEECVATYDGICVDFPENDICTGNAHCWANCVEDEGPEVEAVSDCICDNSCTNDDECN